MEKLNNFLWMIQGFNIMYNGDVFTTTLWAQFVCDRGVMKGNFEKINKNYYKYIG